MVPEFAADGKGKMAKGGMTKSTPMKKMAGGEMKPTKTMKEGGMTKKTKGMAAGGMTKKTKASSMGWGCSRHGRGNKRRKFHPRRLNALFNL
jgi:hypothetical protein